MFFSFLNIFSSIDEILFFFLLKSGEIASFRIRLSCLVKKYMDLFVVGFFLNWSTMPISFLHLYIIGDSERPENAKSELEEYCSLGLTMC